MRTTVIYEVTHSGTYHEFKSLADVVRYMVDTYGIDLSDFALLYEKLSDIFDRVDTYRDEDLALVIERREVLVQRKIVRNRDGYVVIS